MGGGERGVGAREEGEGAGEGRERKEGEEIKKTVQWWTPSRGIKAV